MEWDEAGLAELRLAYAKQIMRQIDIVPSQLECLAEPESCGRE